MRLNVWGLVLATGMLSALPAAGTASEDVCNSIPSRCIINGKIDKECLCKIWCEAACGGSACNCDILPVKVAGKTVETVRNKSCQGRINTVLTGKAQF